MSGGESLAERATRESPGSLTLVLLVWAGTIPGVQLVGT